MTGPSILCGVVCACALGGAAMADLTIDVGRLSNTNPAPEYSYVGDWAQYISSSEVEGYTVLEIDITGIMAEGGERYLRSVSIHDFGNNSYGELSPGADIDLLEFAGLDSSVDVIASYEGPTPDHLEETSQALLGRLAELDAFTGANQRDDDVYVSLGRLGQLELMFSGGGGGDGGGGVIDPFGNDGLAGNGLLLRISEAGSHERFTVHLNTTDVPAPAAAPILAALLAGCRRRRA